MQSCNDKSGVSYQSVMKYIVRKYPGMELDKKKFLIKKAMKKHLEKGTIKQVKSVKVRVNTFYFSYISLARLLVSNLGKKANFIHTNVCFV